MAFSSPQSKGFTLAELLIALAILGVIATFTIPKILQSQQNASYTAIGKETAATISSAYNAYLSKNALTAGILPRNLTPYMNYVKNDSTAVVDNMYTLTTADCSTAAFCLKLHNGAMLYSFDNSFAGTATTNAIYFYLDPDGQVTDGTTNGPGKAVLIFIYTNGRIVTWKDVVTGTVTSDAGRGPCPGCDPPWFTWN